MINIILIQILICYVIDLSGFIQSLEMWLNTLLKVKVHIPRPFSCSLCLGWWVNIIYLIVTHNFTLPLIIMTALISFFSKNITGLLRWISELFVFIEGWLYKLIKL